MSHVDHLRTYQSLLRHRFAIIRVVREFFWSRGFTEVETPNILALPGQEPYLSPMEVAVRDERGNRFSGYLHTSPEYTMKKMLAAGYGDIFSICKTYRNEESFGGTHNPEFTMIEWYRSGEMEGLMDDLDGLFVHLIRTLRENFQFQISNFKTVSNERMFKRLSMKEIWQRHVGVDLDQYLDADSMKGLCTEKGYNLTEDEKYEDLFYRIFLNEIEPYLIEPTILYRYPAQMAALAKLSEVDPRYADRFEVYIDGMELANAFGELTDPKEQQKRLADEQALRAKLGKAVYAIDTDFILAVGQMPPCAGIALGIDRLVQILLGISDIDQILPLPMSDLFDTKNSSR